jgi:hypothetical protein
VNRYVDRLFDSSTGGLETTPEDDARDSLSSRPRSAITRFTTISNERWNKARKFLKAKVLTEIYRDLFRATNSLAAA